MTVSAVVYEPAPLSGQSVPKASGGWFWNRAAVVCCPPCDDVLPLQGSVAVNSGYIMFTAMMAFGALEHPVDVSVGRRAPAGAHALRRSEIHRVQNEVLCDGCISLSNGEALWQVHAFTVLCSLFFAFAFKVRPADSCGVSAALSLGFWYHFGIIPVLFLQPSRLSLWYRLGITVVLFPVLFRTHR